MNLDARQSDAGANGGGRPSQPLSLRAPVLECRLHVDIAYNPHLRRQVASLIEGGVILAVYRDRRRRRIAHNLHSLTLVLEGSLHCRRMSRDLHSSNYIDRAEADLSSGRGMGGNKTRAEKSDFQEE